MCLKFVHKYNIANNLIRTEIIDGEFINTLQYSNSAEYRSHPSSIVKKGSLIDIDTFRVYRDNTFSHNIMHEINSAHKSEKELFYSLLKQDFIQELDPVYE